MLVTIEDDVAENNCGDKAEHFSSSQHDRFLRCRFFDVPDLIEPFQQLFLRRSFVSSRIGLEPELTRSVTHALLSAVSVNWAVALGGVVLTIAFPAQTDHVSSPEH